MNKKYRTRLTPQKAQFLGLEVKGEKTKKGWPRYSLDEDQLKKLSKFDNENESLSDSNDYQNRKKDEGEGVENENTSLVLDAWNDEGKMMDIDEYCDHYGLPRNQVASYKLVSHTGTPYYNIVFREVVELDNIENDHFEEMIDRVLNTRVSTQSMQKVKLPGKCVDRLVFTDVHIGMEPNITGESLYGGSWNKEDIRGRFNKMIEKTIAEKRGSTLIIDDLGDLLDGWEGFTARGGHKLPQNMDSAEAFEFTLELKVNLVDQLAPHYAEIIVNNICNDNHSSTFGYVLNHAFKNISERAWQGVTVNNHKRFINHYYIGNHAIVITHGKDDKNLKFGFKPKLDDTQASKIDQYLKNYDVYQNSKYIHFCKGDSHVALFDPSSSDYFEYNNYPAFCPASDWIQTNFKRNRSGFTLERIYPNENRVDRTVHYFDWE